MLLLDARRGSAPAAAARVCRSRRASRKSAVDGTPPQDPPPYIPGALMRYASLGIFVYELYKLA